MLCLGELVFSWSKVTPNRSQLQHDSSLEWDVNEMYYNRFVQNKKVQAECGAHIGTPRHDGLPNSNVPVYSAFFSAIVSGITGLLGSLFFVYKWFQCLNYLIGRKLFKGYALTVVWAGFLAMAVFSVLMVALHWGKHWKAYSWLLVFVWIGRIVFITYLLSQLRRSRELAVAVRKRLKILFGILYALWSIEIGIWVIWYCRNTKLWWPSPHEIMPYCGWITLAVFILIEIGLVQRMFNIVVGEVSKNRSSLDDKIANDWCRFRIVTAIVTVWGVVALSSLLFLWDVSKAVLRGNKYGIGGGSRFLSFIVNYSPHAGWQLCLWGIAALLIVFYFYLPGGAIRRFFTSLFPNVGSRKGTEV